MSTTSSTATIESKTGLKSTDVDANTKPTINKEKKPSSVKSNTKASKESESKNPTQASLSAIQIALSNDKIREDFLNNAADSLCSYSRRKMDDDEKQTFKNLIDNELINKVLKVKRLAA